MSADQVSIILIVILVVLVANLAIMAGVLLMGRRRRASTRVEPIDDGSSTNQGEPAEDQVVARRVAAIAASAAPAGGTRPADAAAPTGSGEPETVGSSGADLQPTFLPDDEAIRMLLVDRLTGLDSRLAWERMLRDEETRQLRYRRPVTVVVAELEGLERLAARLGSEVAGRVVAAVAGTIRANARSSDRAALLGPGRFGVLLPETDEIQAVNFVERVRSVCDLWLEAGAVSVRIGFGWASPGTGTDLRTARRVAEERLDRDRRHPPLPLMGGLTHGIFGPAADGDRGDDSSGVDDAGPGADDAVGGSTAGSDAAPPGREATPPGGDAAPPDREADPETEARTS